MRLNSHEAISMSSNRMQKNTGLVEKSINRLSTGITTGKGDNASGVSLSETMRAQIRGISRAQLNMQDGLSVLEASNEGMNNVNGLLQRARELAVMNATGTLTDADRSMSEMELKQLFSAIDDTAERLEFNTKKILGENASIVLQVGANSGQSISIDMVDVSTTALGLTGATLGTQNDSEQLIGKIDSALSKMAGNLTKVGSYMESIEHHLANAKVFEGNLTKSLSVLQDTDIAKEMMNFVSLDIRQKGDQLLVTHVNKNIQDTMSLFSK
jgi:flagellin